MSKRGLLGIAVLLELSILSPADRIPKATAAENTEAPIVSGRVRDPANVPVAGESIPTATRSR